MTGTLPSVTKRYGLSRTAAPIAAATPPGSRVLDVGCATGYLARYLADARGCEVVGVELDSVAAGEARAHCSEVVVGDITSPETRRRLDGPFDVVVVADVLEHLVDPGGTLRYARTLLGEDGTVVASIPNVAVWRSRLQLAAGRFDYADSGTFDRTHLRFFTRRTARALAEESGYRVLGEACVPAEPPWPLKLRRVLPEEAVEALITALTRLYPGLFAEQFVLTLKPKPGMG